MHRIAWNHRYPSQWRSNGSGPLALPGTYTAQIFKYENEIFHAISDVQSFEIRSLGLATMEASDKEAVLQFQMEAERLQRALTQTNQFVQDKMRQLNTIQEAVIRSTADITLFQQAGEMEKVLADANFALNGDLTRRRRAEFVAPGLLARLRRVLGGLNSTASTTETHKSNYEIALAGFEELYGKLQSMMDNEWTELLNNLALENVNFELGSPLPPWTRR